MTSFVTFIRTKIERKEELLTIQLKKKQHKPHSISIHLELSHYFLINVVSFVKAEKVTRK